MGSPVLVNSHTAEDFKGRLPSFWGRGGRYRATPRSLGTYGLHYAPFYSLRERNITLGNITERLVQVLHGHHMCSACAVCAAWTLRALGACAVRVPCVCRACAVRARVHPWAVRVRVRVRVHAMCRVHVHVRVQAPPWLFAAESDANPPAGLDASGQTVHSGRVTSSFWAAQPSPVALVHFVCFAWPGSGGRVAAMRLWGRWHQPDISAQLAPVALRPSAIASEAPTPRPFAPRLLAPRPLPFGFDAHSWLRACGLACGMVDCARDAPRGGGGARPWLRLCAEWLHLTTWRVSPLQAWLRKQRPPNRTGVEGEVEGRVAEGREVEGRGAEGHASLGQASRGHGDLRGELGGELGGDLEAQIRREAWEVAAVPQDLAEATARAAARHPSALVAFRRPLVAADRREYQLYVHLLHSAAMLSGRRPVLPLAHCNQVPTIATAIAGSR